MEKIITTRRSKKELKELVVEATKRLISKVGFSNITLYAVIEEAGIDHNVFYRHFGTMDAVFEIISKQYDFWINDTIDMSKLRELTDRDFLIEGFKDLYTALDKNDVMQKILLWEIEETNETTRKSADMRETLNLNLLGYYEKIFHTSSIDFKAISALFIAGIYYIILHKNVSSFCTIDFSTDKGVKQLLKSIKLLINLLFDKLDQEQKQNNMSKKMLEDGVPQLKIDEYLKILTK